MSPDPIDAFFDELGRRGHEPLLDRGESVGRFDITRDDHIDHWLILIKEGDIEVSREEGAEPDWVMRADRHDFECVIDSEVGALAALIRGTLSVRIDSGSQSFALLNRLFARAPESRKGPGDGHRPGGGPA